jgi:hypothetical protein
MSSQVHQREILRCALCDTLKVFFAPGILRRSQLPTIARGGRLLVVPSAAGRCTTHSPARNRFISINDLGDITSHFTV